MASSTNSGGIASTYVNGVKVYNISAGKSLSEFAEEKRSMRLLKRDANFLRRIELLQDFEFVPNGSSQCIASSADGQYIYVSGTYPPILKCFDLANLALKFERHCKKEIIKFLILSDDYKKLVVMQDSRTIECHAQFGSYYSFNIPKPGRDMFYNYPSCELYMVGSSEEAYRFNLEIGRFLRPLVTKAGQDGGLNVCKENPVHQLIALGGDNGCEFFDPRTLKQISQLNLSSEVTALGFDNDGITMAIGTAQGMVSLYDLRMPNPLLVKEHEYGDPIKTINFHHVAESRYVMSSDKHLLKIWEKSNGKTFTMIEPPGNINDVNVTPNTGLIMMACEHPKVQSFFVPALGPAPQWCSFLDTITEELEEEKLSDQFENFKFVTKQELDDLGLTPLIGTQALRAHMHGFFMDMRLYRKAKSISEPYETENLYNTLAQ